MNGGGGLAALVPGLAELWAETTGDSEVRVAVLDGPIDRAHPCFAGADLEILPTLVPSAAPEGGAATQHGTFVASLIFGRHGGAIAGVAPGCKGIIAPVFGDGLGGEVTPSSQTDLGRAITQVIERGAAVINISGGELTDSGGMAWPLQDAMKLAAERDVLVVAAAGNDGCRCLHLPAGAPSALVVGAMDASGEPSSFSNFADAYREHGILAPGQDIPGAGPSGSIVRRSGTSYATPIVSGVVALLLSRERRRGRPRRPSEVYDVLLRSATTCAMQPAADCDRVFRGRLNIPAAIEMLDAGADKTMLDAGTAMESNRAHSEAPLAPAGAKVPSTPVLPRQDPPVAAPSPSAVAATLSAVAPSDAAAPEKAPLPDSGSDRVESAPAIPEPPAVSPSGEAAPAENGAPSGGAAPEAGSGVVPSDCGCGSGVGKVVFAIGSLGFDFGSESLRDAFHQANGGPIYDAEALVSYLQANAGQNLSDAMSVIWTLSIDSYPVYAIKPSGPYADRAYARLVQFLADPTVERISVPGWRRAADVTLLSGQTIPAIEPSLGGMSSWSTAALVGHLMSSFPVPVGVNALAVQLGLTNFLNRVYHEARSGGVTAEERALNFSATNAYAAYQIIIQAAAQGLELHSFTTEKSPLCRPESDCWDVVLVFFDPLARSRRARQVFRFTIDVSDVEPVQIGNTRTWQIH